MKLIKRPAVLLLALLIVFSACKAKEEKKVVEDPGVAVRYSKVTRGEITQTLELVRNIKPNRMTVLMSAVPGKIVKVYHREGTGVPEGEPLIDIDPEEIELSVKQAHAGLSAARAMASQARVQRSVLKMDFDRFKELLERDAISQSEFDRAEAAYKASRQAVKQAEANIRNSKALVEKAELYERDLVITAPFGGEIVKLLVEEGGRIQTMPPTPLLALVDYETVQVECSVSERDVGSIIEDTTISVTLDAFPNTSSEAIIERIVPLLDPQTRTFTVIATMDNYEHTTKPGMMARVIVPATFEDILSVHRDAFSLNNITGIIRIVEVVDNIAKERKVIAGRNFGDRVELRDPAGLKEGSIVITSGASGLLAGQKINLAEAQYDVELNASLGSTAEEWPMSVSTKEEVSDDDDDYSSTDDDDLTVDDEDTPTLDDDYPMVDEGDSPDDDLSVDEEEMPSMDDEELTDDEDLSVDDDDMPSMDDEAPMDDEEYLSDDDEAPMDDDSAEGDY